MTDTIEHGGKCRCGSVAFTCTSTPSFSVLCHCKDCRDAISAPVAAFVGFEKNQVDWTSKKTLAEYSVDTATRLFCRECGSPIGYKDSKLPNDIYFYTGIMVEPEAYAPTAHSYAGEAISWLLLNDDLPRVDGTLAIRPKNGATL